MMLRRIAAAGSREALRVRVPAVGSRSAPIIHPAFQSFHAGAPRKEQALEKPLSREEEIAKYANAPMLDMPKTQKIIADYKLDDPKRLLPLALFLSVPALSREWYVVNEETLLMGCFFLFVGACMDFGGASIAKYFDDKSQSILETHNKLEEVQLKVVSAELESTKARLEEVDDVQTIYDIMCYAEKRQAEAMTLMEKHRHRELTVKMLEAFKAGRNKRITELRSAEVEKSLQEILAKISTDKKLKKAALDNALTALADPKMAAKADPVSQMFVQYWKENSANMEKNKDKAVPITPELREKSEADLRAIYAKFGDDASQAVSKIPDSYKPSDANILY